MRAAVAAARNLLPNIFIRTSTMERYRVTGAPIRLSIGELVDIDDKQIKLRSHKVEIVKARKGGALVKAVTELDFKVGEEIGLAAVPRRLDAQLISLTQKPADAA
jgi:hypothetical protein